MTNTGRVILGRIAGAHGIRGDVLIHSYTANPEDIGAYGALTDESGGRVFEITSRRAASNGIVAHIAGVNDRNAAETLKGVVLFISRSQLPPPEEGAYYHADLLGLAVFDEDGHLIGSIAAVQNFGAGDLLEIAATGSMRTELVPFTSAFVPEIDLNLGRAVVRLPVYSGASDGGGENP